MEKNVQMVIPSKEYLDSYLDACREYKKHNVQTFSLHNPDEFDEWSKTIFNGYEKRKNGVDLKPGLVPDTVYWLIENSDFVGWGCIRHYLSPELENFGGHIGYAIRVSKWNQGYATLFLKLLLNEAAKLGIVSALITCDESNIGSARVAEKNGGKYIDSLEGKIHGKFRRWKRYRVPTKIE